MKHSDHPAKFALFALVGVALLAAGWFLMSGDDAGPADWGVAVDDGAYESEEFVEAEALRAESDDSGRSERTELAQEASLPEGEVLLTVSGRVMSTRGDPVSGAVVSVLQRESIDFERMFRGGGPAGGREEMRERFRRRPLTKSVRTERDGTFVLRGRSFEAVEISVAAMHTQLAPRVVNRTWEATEGALQVGDILLDEGLSVRGVVLDDAGQPVSGAEVRYAQEDRSRGRGRGGRDSVLADLVEPVRTNANGLFAMGPLPRTDFRLVADAVRHVEARTSRIEPADAGGVEDQTITLTRAASLSGVVRDAAGNPVAGAEVAAMGSRADRRDDGGDNGGRGRGRDNEGRGRRDRGGRGRRGGSESSTRTDANGKFELTELEPGELRLEIEHDEFLDAERDPVDPRRTPFVEISMETALSVHGVVVDARTGQPVERYGIEARRSRGVGDQNGFDRGGRGRRGNGDADAEEIQRQTREAFIKQRVGGSGETPGRTPKPSTHAGGAFDIGQLEPGDYVFDIDAPGYIKVAAGVVTLEAGRTGPVTLRVERGVTLTGRVVSRDGEPVAAADVQLHVPEAPQAATADNGRNRGGNRGNRGGRGGRGRGGRGGFRRPLARASTDIDGRFELPPLRPGPFALEVTADGMMDHENQNFVLAGGNAQHDVVIKMMAGAVVHGVVLDYQPGDGGRVTLSHTDGERHSATVDARTGEYEIEGLPPGGYFASVSSSNDDNGRRRMFARMLSQPERQPDVFVGEGATVRFDMRSDDADLGTVQGQVWKNGAPATGLEVRLARAEQPGAQAQEEGFRRSVERRLLTGRVRQNGDFEISAVPPGAYLLEVTGDSGGRGGRRGGRGGRGGSGALHTEPVHVQAGSPTVVRVQVSTSELEFVVTAPEGQSGGRLRVSVVSAAEAGERPPQEWRRLSSAQTFTVRDGTTGTQELAPGAYRYAVTGRGIETAIGFVQVSAGSPASVQVSVKAAEGGGAGQQGTGAQGGGGGRTTGTPGQGGRGRGNGR